jgi:hypothetical protein
MEEINCVSAALREKSLEDSKSGNLEVLNGAKVKLTVALRRCVVARYREKMNTLVAGSWQLVKGKVEGL